jgi:preprotein translocase subunit SecD
MNRFNIYLILVPLFAMALGCKSTEDNDRNVLSSLRLHIEAKADQFDRTETVEVDRDSPIKFTVEKVPFLSEKSVKEAKVIDVTGGFELQIEFDHEGGWLLEQYTSANRTKHIVIFSQFANRGEEKINNGRWLAAPQIQKHISDGVFIFTPDATREESERIALGLNHVAKRLATGKEIKW